MREWWKDDEGIKHDVVYGGNVMREWWKDGEGTKHDVVWCVYRSSLHCQVIFHSVKLSMTSRWQMMRKETAWHSTRWGLFHSSWLYVVLMKFNLTCWALLKLYDAVTHRAVRFFCFFFLSKMYWKLLFITPELHNITHHSHLVLIRESYAPHVIQLRAGEGAAALNGMDQHYTLGSGSHGYYLTAVLEYSWVVHQMFLAT